MFVSLLQMVGLDKSGRGALEKAPGRQSRIERKYRAGESANVLRFI